MWKNVKVQDSTAKVRTTNALINAFGRDVTLGEVAKKSPSELLAVENLGKASFCDIRAVIDAAIAGADVRHPDCRALADE